MALPIDLSAVLKAATSIEEAAKTPLSVTVVVDPNAPNDLVGHVRQAFASAAVNARVSILYLDEHEVKNVNNDDMAVIIAGTSDTVGQQAAKFREAGVPVMIATNMPKLVRDMAQSMGFPIPDGDLISPLKEVSLFHTLGIAAKQSADLPESLDELMPLDEDAASILDENMGQWVIAACSGRKLAFALAFPFVRRPLAQDVINATSAQNAAVGFVPFIPGADMPIMTLNQAKMIMQIAAAYGQPLDKSRIKELAALVAGAFAMRSVARSAAKLVPGVGWVVSGAVGYTGTEAMGRAAVDYFEAGGDLKGLANVAQTAKDDALDVAKKAADSKAGKKAIEFIKTGVSNAVSFGKKRAS